LGAPGVSATQTPAISVVVPIQNMAGSIGDCIEALSRQTLPRQVYEILVVDDGSTDDSVRIARQAGATRVLSKPRGGYAAAARNLGIREARGEILCFTDADCRPHPDWLAQITAPFAVPEIAGAKGTYATDQRSLVARFVQLEYEEKYDHLRGQERISFIDFYSAAFRRQVLISNGGFDERFPNSEDRELSFRLATRGYKMVFQPYALVNHTHADNLPGYFRKKVRNGYWTAQVVRRFPTHGVDDSYTPQALKLQILLMGMLFSSLALIALTPWAALLPIVILLTFVVTAIPLTRIAWQRDRTIAFAAPFLQAVRGTALGLGYAWGILRPIEFEPRDVSISGLNYVAKRALDVLAGLVGVTLTALLLPLVAVRSRGRGALFSRQKCLGQHGQIFLLRSFGAGAAVHGRWRNLPQFWHILRGEMSLVGPWPEREEALADYEDWHRQRLAVKPGLITPIAGNTECRDARIRLEIEYITSYSLWRDVRIVLREI